MPDNLTFSWFKLFSIEGYGSARIHRLHARARMNNVSIADIFQLTQTDIDRVFAPRGEEIYAALHNCDEESVNRHYGWLLANDVELIHPEHTLYPERLLTMFLDSAPVMLFALGKLDLLRADGVAIVGSRDAEPLTLDLSGKIAALSVKKEWNVVSGYARGVDTAAHIAALKAGGSTTMVLSCGLEHFYLRPSLKELSGENNSLVLSQFYPWAQWEKHHAILRNQLIVGLSKAVIVIQATEKSGTLNTANAALKAGVPLFALSPSSFQIPSAGSVEIIKRGAVEINSIAEIDERLNQLKVKTSVVNLNDSDIQNVLPL